MIPRRDELFSRKSQLKCCVSGKELGEERMAVFATQSLATWKFPVYIDACLEEGPFAIGVVHPRYIDPATSQLTKPLKQVVEITDNNSIYYHNIEALMPYRYIHWYSKPVEQGDISCKCSWCGEQIFREDLVIRKTYQNSPQLIFHNKCIRGYVSYEQEKIRRIHLQKSRSGL